MIKFLTSEYQLLDMEEGECELDLGCGKGGFTCRLAEKYPMKTIFGADVMIGRLRRLERKAQRLSLGNLTLLRVNAWTLFGFMLPDESIDRIHVICPDPWPKDKHRPNRLLCSEFLGRVRRVLRKNGVLHFATDNENYFSSVTSLLNEMPILHRDDIRIADMAGIKSDFEEKWENQGLEVKHAAWRKYS